MIALREQSNDTENKEVSYGLRCCHQPVMHYTRVQDHRISAVQHPYISRRTQHIACSAKDLRILTASSNLLSCLVIPREAFDMSTVCPVMNNTSETAHEPVYWSSYSKASSNASPPSTKSFLLSVVLDDGTCADFSGIQVLVVYKENEWLNNVVCLYGSSYK